ncbi:hypothetical protein D3C74_315980 [compost metagenome]
MPAFDFNSLHVLTADIENVIYIRKKEGCCPIVGHRLYFPAIDTECGFHKSLAISGNIRVSDEAAFVQSAIDFRQGFSDRSKRISLVAAIEGVKYLMVYSGQHELRCCRSGIDA